MRKCGSLHLKIRFRVDIRCIERDMTEPGADRVDVNAGPKQVARAGMANGMRADAFCHQSWHFGGDLPGIALHHCVNAKPGEWASAPIDKDMLGWSFLRNQCLKFAHRVTPQRTEAQLVALATNPYRRMVPAWCVGELEVADPELRSFIGSSAGIVEE